MTPHGSLDYIEPHYLTSVGHMQQPKNIITVKTATLWPGVNGSGALNINFDIPNTLAAKYSTRTDEEAYAMNARAVSEVMAATRSFMPRAVQEEALEHRAAAESQDVQYRHALSRSEVLRKRLLDHLHSLGCPATVTAYSGNGFLGVTIPVDAAPDKVLGLADTLKEQGLLKQDVSLDELKARKHVETSPPHFNTFLIGLNQAVLGPSNSKDGLRL
jgi:hypothetical protein